MPVITSFEVKCALSTLPFAVSYSSCERRSLSSLYSRCQLSLFSSNACGKPPHPTYLARVFFSDSVGAFSSRYSFLTSLIASTLFLNRCFAPPNSLWSNPIASRSVFSSFCSSICSAKLYSFTSVWFSSVAGAASDSEFVCDFSPSLK